MDTQAYPIPKNWKTPFFTVWGGQAASLLGSQLVQFALIWWLTQTTGSATVLATATLVGLLPNVFIGPIAGTLVDRWNRRWVMVCADGLIALATLVLALLFYLGNVQVWQVYLLLFLRSALGGFHWPAMAASTSLMVPQEHLARVQGANQALNGLLNIGAAPLGALLLVVLPMQGILSIDILTAMIAIGTLLVVSIPQPVRSDLGAKGEAAPSFWQDFRLGWRYVFTWPGMVYILILATLINLLLTPATSLMPILVTRQFHGQAFQLAWLELAWGVGVVAGGLALGIWGGFKRRIVTSLLGLVLIGAGMLGVGYVPSGYFLVAVALMFVVGFGGPIVDGPLFAMVQAIVAPEMQGRVFTIIVSFAHAVAPLGLLLAGPLADKFGVQVWFRVGGLATVLMAVAASFVPAIMHIEDSRHPALAAAESAGCAGERALAGGLRADCSRLVTYFT